MSGVPCIRGTHIPVSVIVGRIAEGLSTEEIIAEFPQVAPQDVAAAVEFATAAVDLREVPLGTVKAGALREPRSGSEVDSLRAPLVRPAVGALRAPQLGPPSASPREPQLGPAAGSPVRELPRGPATDGTLATSSIQAANPQATNGGQRRGRVRGRVGKSESQPGERVEVLSSELVVVPDSVATELRIPRGGWAIRRRQLTVNGTAPLELSTWWFDGRLADRAPRLLEPANVREGTVAYLQKVTSHRAAKAHNVITVRHASAEEKRLLRLAGSRPPVVITRHLVAASDGAPMQFVETVRAPERWAVTVPEPTEPDQSSIPASPPSGRRPTRVRSRLFPGRAERAALHQVQPSDLAQVSGQAQPSAQAQPPEQAKPQDEARPQDQPQPWDQAQPQESAPSQDQGLPDAVRHLAALPTSLPDAMSVSQRSWPVAKEWLGTHGPWLVLLVLALILIAALGVLATAPFLWTWA